MTNPDPEADAALAEALRLMTEARQANAPPYTCERCGNRCSLDQLWSCWNPCVCQDCVWLRLRLLRRG